MTKRSVIGIIVFFIILVLVFALLYVKGDSNRTVIEGTINGAPTETPTENAPEPLKEIITTLIDEGATALNLQIIPRIVVEDSRCPRDVQCIQAGTVRVNSHLISPLGESDIVFTLGNPVSLYNKTITLIDVTPVKISTTTIPIKSYHFIFEVKEME